MKGSRIRRALASLALALVVALALVGTALAHDVTFDTDLSLHRSPGGTVASGTQITFSGAPSSSKAACERNSRIDLIKVGSGVVERTRTGAQGGYSFQRKVYQTQNWRTRFRGKVLSAVHPHNHVCGASVSRTIQVPVG